METHPQIGKSIQNQTTMIDEPLRGEAGAPEEGCVEYSNGKQGANTAERWRRDGAIDDIDTAALKRSLNFAISRMVSMVEKQTLKCHEVEKMKGDTAKIRKLLKHTIRQTKDAQAHVAQAQAAMGAVQAAIVALISNHPPLSQQQLFEGLQRVERMVVLAPFTPVRNGVSLIEGSDKLGTLENELNAPRSQVRRREQQCEQLNGDFASTKSKMERKWELHRGTSLKSKESETRQEECLQQVEHEEQRFRKTEALHSIALKESEVELAELKMQSLVISLQYERQCEVIEGLEKNCQDSSDKLKGVRAALKGEVMVLKKQLQTEVRCRAKVASQLRSTRMELQRTRVQLASGDAQKRELRRQLKHSNQLNRMRQRKEGKAISDLTPSHSYFDCEYDGANPQQLLRLLEAAHQDEGQLVSEY